MDTNNLQTHTNTYMLQGFLQLHLAPSASALSAHTESTAASHSQQQQQQQGSFGLPAAVSDGDDKSGDVHVR